MARLLTPCDGIPFSFVSPHVVELQFERDRMCDALSEIFELALKTDGAEYIAVLASQGMGDDEDS